MPDAIFLQVLFIYTFVSLLAGGLALAIIIKFIYYIIGKRNNMYEQNNIEDVNETKK